jgi:hypothetical protein
MSRNAKHRQGSSHARRRAIRLETGPERRAEAASFRLEERIARRAYEIHVERGRQEGRELDDWLQAEKEIAAEEG